MWTSFASLVRGRYIPELDTYGECVCERMLRSCDDLDQEVGEKGDKLYEAALRTAGDEYDSAADWANDEAMSWGVLTGGLMMGLTGLFAVGLYHLFEQQAGRLCRELNANPRLPAPDGRGVQTTVADLVAALKRRDVDVSGFAEWSAIYNELRNLANTCKHAEGHSADELRRLRPDLFRFPGLPLGEPMGIIEQPLVGEGPYISEQEFKHYLEAVRSFWRRLADRFAERESARGKR
jgi:hypothetical protein